MRFVHPAFLWGLLAIAIPIVVHLFHFRRYRTLYFSDTHFIQELQSENKRQSQLKKRILLSLRILAICALVLAFAQPYRPHGDDSFTKGKACVLLYVDNSFSMENSAAEGSLLNEARNQALAVVEAFSESDAFLLLTNDLEGRHARFLNRTDMKDAIVHIQPSPVSRSMDEIISYGLSFCGKEKNPNRQIFLISDFQKSTCPLSRLPQDSSWRIHFCPLKPNQARNLFIDSCWFEQPVFLRNQACKLHIVLRNTGKEDIEKLPVKLFVNGKQAAIATADLEAGGRALAEMSFTPEGEGLQQAWLEITDDPVTYDDRLYFSFRVRSRQNVLCVYGEKESPFLHALFADDSAIAYQCMPLRQMDYARLPQQQLVILDQVEDVSSGCLQELQQYVEKGGSLLCIPGTHSEKVLRNDIGTALGITAFTGLDTQRSRVAEVQLSHRLFAHTMEAPPENIQWPAVFRHYRCAKGVIPGKEVLVSLENGDEFLSMQRLGKGNVSLLSVPLDDRFSEFQRHALIVPVLYNISMFSSEPLRPYYVLGENRPIPMEGGDATDGLPELRQERLQFSCIPEVRNSYNSSELFFHDQVREAENYLLCSKEDTLQVLSFNYSRLESDLEYWSPAEIRKYCKEVRNTRLLSIQHQSAATVAGKIGRQEKHGGAFLWIALALLLAETLLLRLWKE